MNWEDSRKVLRNQWGGLLQRRWTVGGTVRSRRHVDAILNRRLPPICWNQIEAAWAGQLRATWAMSARQLAGIVVPGGDPYDGGGQREDWWRGAPAMSAVTIYGLCAVTFMMAMYAFERRGPIFVLAFAAGCILSGAYGFWSGAWPFGAAELVWSAIAVRRYRVVVRSPAAPAEEA